MRDSGKTSIAYYVSAHGYGHGVRSCDIIRALNREFPQIDVNIVSDLPPGFLSNRIGSLRNLIRPGSFDVGMVQLDSIRVDVSATIDKVKRLYAKRKELVAQELEFIHKNHLSLIVVDIPAIPLESARLAGIPKIAVGNFGWDWIYSGFSEQDPRWIEIADIFREQYGLADLLLRLPFSEEMNAFRNIEDIPVLASPGVDRRSEIVALTGCDPGKKWILLSFTTLDWNEDSLKKVEQIDGYEFFTILPLTWNRRNIHPINREQVSFSDALASSDAVISKPGFGILSDCVVNQKPLIYADRSDFLEYAILESAIKKYLKNVHIPSADLYRGDLSENLSRIWNSPNPSETIGRGGDVAAARRIAHMAGVI